MPSISLKYLQAKWSDDCQLAYPLAGKQMSQIEIKKASATAAIALSKPQQQTIQPTYKKD